MFIGTVVKDDEGRVYSCRLSGPHEQELAAPDYAPGCFVCVPIGQVSAIGVICHTILFDSNPGTLARPLTPKRLRAKVVLASITMLGTAEQLAAPGQARITHGAPPLSPEPGSSVETMSEEEVRDFHFFSDEAGEDAYLHIGYLPRLIAEGNSLLLAAAMNILDQLERLFPQHFLLLSIVKRDFARRYKMATTGGGEEGEKS